MIVPRITKYSAESVYLWSGATTAERSWTAGSLMMTPGKSNVSHIAFSRKWGVWDEREKIKGH